MEDGTWKAFLKSPPVDGKANEELIRLLSKSFGCPKSMIKISKGATSSYKQILIED